MARFAAQNFCGEHRDLAKKIAAGECRINEMDRGAPGRSATKIDRGAKSRNAIRFAPEAVAQAWKRIKFTTEVSRDLVDQGVQDGKDAGFFKGDTDTSKLLETP